MARKKKHEEHENLERWLVSYADFITLLFAFFVVLYAMSSLNEGKYRILTESLISAFQTEPRSLTPIELGHIQIIRTPNIISHEQTTANSETVNDDSIPQSEATRELLNMADEIEKAMATLIEENLIEVRRFQNWLEVEINTNILFPSGSAEIVTAARPILTKIAKILRRFPNPVNVEGYTDSVPISTRQFPSNWELSAGRAASVVHLFSREGVDPERMSAIGYGQYHAVGDNATYEGRSKNRRVLLVILSHDLPQVRRGISPNDQRLRQSPTLPPVQGADAPQAAPPAPAAPPLREAPREAITVPSFNRSAQR